MQLKENDKNHICRISAAIIYDEIAQDLCLVKMNLTMSETMETEDIRENIKKAKALITKSILQLRNIGESLQEAEKKCRRYKK